MRGKKSDNAEGAVEAGNSALWGNAAKIFSDNIKKMMKGVHRTLVLFGQGAYTVIK
ncbi:MAG: hypothetical protein Q4B73_06210 [Lachnospiraceae bacterium]|nr:hypothetical protein [Lachnospiraceae bacterium]